MKIIKGQQVHIKPEYQDKGDEHIRFYAVEDSDGDRVLVVADCGLPINPTSVVQLSMLHEVSNDKF